MPYTVRNFNHLPRPTQFSVGPTTGLFENLESGFRRQREVESAYGFEVDLRNRYREQLERAAQLSGEDMSMGWWNALEGMGAGARREAGGDPYSDTIISRGNIDDYLRDIDDRDKRIAELKKQDPSLKTFKEIFAEEQKRRAELLGETNLAASRAGFWGSIGQFLGGVAGSFDPERDPLLFSSLGIPIGAGGSLIRRMAIEALVGAGVEGLQQQLLVNPKHKLLGEEENNVVASMLFAAVGSAAFRGAGEGAPLVYRAAEARVAPNRAAARIIAEEFAKVHGRPMDPGRLPKRLTNAQLSEAIDDLPRTPEWWGMQATLTNERLTAEASPHNLEVGFGRLQTEEAVSAARREFEGLPEKGTPGTRLIDETTTLVRGEPVVQEAPLPRSHPGVFFFPGEGTGRTRASGHARGLSGKEKGVVRDLRVPNSTINKLADIGDEEVYARLIPREELRTMPFSRGSLVHDDLLTALREQGYTGFKIKRPNVDVEEIFILPEHLENLRYEPLLTESADPIARPSLEETVRLAEEFDVEKVADATVEDALVAVGRGPETAEPPALPVEKPTTVNFGDREISLDLEVPTAEGKTQTARQILDDLADDEALLQAAKECGI